MSEAPILRGRAGRDGLVAAYRCLAAGDLRGARDEWRAVRRLAPGFTVAYVEEARLLQRLGESEAAEAVLVEAIAALPGAPDLVLAYAAAAADRADWPEAARRFGAAQRQYPGHPAFHAGLVRALRRLGRNDEADAALRDGPGDIQVDDDPPTLTDDDAAARRKQALDAFERGDLAAAGAGFAELRQARPTARTVSPAASWCCAG